MTCTLHAFILALFAAAITVQTQPYPVKPIRSVVPYPPGGSTGIIGSAIAQKLAEGLGQPVIIDNRGGAVGSLMHADPAAELPLLALVLGATVVLRSADAARTLPAAEIFIGPLTTAEIARKERSVFRGAMVTLRNAFT